MRKIRVGNDFWQSFQVKENGVIVDLLQIKDTVQVFAKVGDKSFEVPKEMVQIKEDGIITMEVKTELFNIVGRYEIIVKYWHHDISMSDDDRKQAVNFSAFTIVSTSAMADDLEDVPIVGDIIIGLKGDSAFDIWNAKNGGNNTYDDWIDFLQAPATQIEGIVSANEAVRIENENTRKANEQTRQSNESARVTAEIDRESNEDTRSLNEAARLTNEDDRIANENQRVIDEGKREQLYDNTVILKGEVETLKTETETAKDSAISAATLANDKANLANDAAQNATNATIEAQTATQEATTAASLADTARVAIQDDLALKADHGYSEEENPKTLKEVEDDTSVKMTNLITNGDFSNGVTGWSSQNGILSVMNNELTHTGNSNTTGTSVIRVYFNSISNNKYYIAYETYISDEVSMLYLEHMGGLETNRITNKITETWIKAEMVISAAGTASNYITFVALFRNDENVDKLLKLRNVKIINLTETFGAGNEPTKEEMNLLIPTLGIDYFEGEIIIPAQKVMQWQLKMIRQNRSAIIALGGTIV